MTWNDELLAQYHAATTTSATIALSGWTTVRITGADRASFLHNMCTNDIRALKTEDFDGFPVGQLCEAFFTDVKGKILGHAIVLALPDEFLAVTVPSQAEALIRSLDRYIIREDVQLADATAEFAWRVDVGPSEATQFRDKTWSVGGDREGDWVVARCTQIWPGGCWSGTRADRPHAYVPPSNRPVDERVWHALRIESGWPLFGVDFDGSNLPQEVGRDAQAINFRKGCYLGQETIARIDALGHVNKRLATVRLAGEAAAGDELLADGQVVGVVSSASYSPRLGGWLALAMVRRGHNEPGAKLLCRGEPAEVVPTPAVVA